MRMYKLCMLAIAFIFSSLVFSAPDFGKVKPIINEIVSSETTYSNVLKTLILELPKLKKEAGFFDLTIKSNNTKIDEFTVIVRNIFDQEQFLLKEFSGLKKVMDSGATSLKELNEKMSVILNYIKDNNKYYNPYSKYFSKYKDFMKIINASTIKGYDFASGLINPIQRPPRYELLFKDLTKRLEELVVNDKQNIDLGQVYMTSKLIVNAIADNTKKLNNLVSK